MTDQTPTPAATTDAGTPPAADTTKVVDTGNQKPGEAAAAVKPGQDQFLFEKAKAEPTPEEKAAAAAKAAEGAKSGENKEDKPAEPEVKFEDLKLPEGMMLPDEIKAELAPVFKELKLDTPNAQKLVDAQSKIEQYKINQWENMKLGWKNEIMADPDLGGKNAETTRIECDRVIRQFSGGNPKHLEGLQDMLVLLGAGSNPHFVRFLHNVAKATKEDTAAGNGGNGEKKEISPEARLWPSMKATT